MKEAGYDHWNSPNTGATNSSGWTGLPGGYRYSGGFDYDGITGTGGLLQSPVPTHGYVYWTTSTTMSAEPQRRYYGFSARCVRD